MSTTKTKKTKEPQGVLSVLLNKDYRCFKKGMKIQFKEGVNLLVGDQGSGKSTLLELLSDSNGMDEVNVELHEHTRVNGTQFMYFDTETMNPRMTSAPLGATGDQFAAHISLKWTSHGEAMNLVLVPKLDKLKNVLIMIDEPESGLSLRSQHKLAVSIRKAAKRGCQLFIATHSQVLI